MKRSLLIAIGILIVIRLAAQEEYFTDRSWTIYNGFRNFNIETFEPGDHLDFLNYVYTQKDKADYLYFDVATRLQHADKYIIEASIGLYNNLEPYSYNLSYNHFMEKNFGLIFGSFSNRFFLKEFNGFYESIIDKKISTRYVNRQWKFSMMAIYFGPTFTYKYNTIYLYTAIKTGACSFVPFNQRNIIKESQSNYKVVYDYETNYAFRPFIMPEIELVIDIVRYKEIILGCKLEFRHLLTRNLINYDKQIYEWTYESPAAENVRLPIHRIQHTDWDFGINIRW